MGKFECDMNKQGITDLTNYLNKCRDEYYNQSESSISDSDYDILFEKLVGLEKQYKFSLPNSPTKNVGYTVLDALPKHTHKTPLLSLNKTKLVDDIVKFANGRVLIAMLKLDGLTVELEYNNGILIKGSTRGNGEVGSDITFHIYKFRNVPIRIEYKGLLRISGEAVILQEDFDKINLPLEEKDKYKTRRNLASGTLMGLDNKITEERGLYFYGYNILEYENILKTKNEHLVELISLGFEVTMWISVFYNFNNESIKNIVDKLKQYALDKGIAIDGIVFTHDDIAYGESLGQTSHHPLHSIAFKFFDEEVETTLTDIVWQVGRTGVLTPVGIFDRVEIDGTDVNQASLHNVSIVEGLQLGIGDSILVHKCNQIIPQIKENLTKSNTIQIPKLCPICNSPTIIEQKDKSKVLKCTNQNCGDKLLAKLSHFCSKPAMNIDGVSDATLQFLIDKGWIKNFVDLYSLDIWKQEWIHSDGFGETSVNKALDAIENSRKVKLENFIVALGIPLIGKSASKTISKYFSGDWFKLEQAIIDGFDFTQLEDFGITMRGSIYEWYSKFCTNEDIKLTYEMNFIKEEPKITNSKLANLTFVITGTLELFTNRKELENMIESNGGKVSGSVSKSTSRLINNDNLSSSSKNKKAIELNIPIITEQEFMDMIN